MEEIPIRHKVAIAGTVNDEITKQPIVDAVIELVSQNLHIHICEEGSFYVIDRPKGLIKLPTSLAKIRNGFFYFMDLPDGEYTLKVSAPNLESRYEPVKEQRVIAPNWQFLVQLSPTRLIGQVKRSDNNEPIANAVVKLGGSEYQTFTDEKGEYILLGIVASQPKVQVSHQRFEQSFRTVELTAGKEHIQDFSLKPLS
jgi:Carboxypeptidase regulatory-like domain